MILFNVDLYCSRAVQPHPRLSGKGSNLLATRPRYEPERWREMEMEGEEGEDERTGEGRIGRERKGERESREREDGRGRDGGRQDREKDGGR